MIVVGKIGFSGTTIYTTSKGECNEDISKIGLNEKKECLNSGYYIDDKRVNINIGTINCGRNVKIVSIKVDKDMNVDIVAGEKESIVGDAWCKCNPSLNIKFSKKVKSVHLIRESDKAELSECK